MWEISSYGVTGGPYSADDLRAIAASGALAPTTPARRVGRAEWSTLEASGLAPSVADAPSHAALASLRKRAAWAHGALLVFAFAALALAAVLTAQLVFLLRISWGAFEDLEQLDAEAEFIDAAGLVMGALVLLSAVAAVTSKLFWVNRSVRNARIVAPELVTIAPSWAVIYNLVPIYSLWMPHKSMSQVLIASRRRGAIVDVGCGAVSTWWATWMISTVISRASYNTSMRGGGALNDLIVWLALDLVSLAMALIGCLALLRIIRAITAAQLNWRPARDA